MLKCKYRWTEIGVLLKFMSNQLWLHFLCNVYSLPDLLRVIRPNVGFAVQTGKNEPPAFLKK